MAMSEAMNWYMTGYKDWSEGNADRAPALFVAACDRGEDGFGFCQEHYNAGCCGAALDRHMAERRSNGNPR